MTIKKRQLFQCCLLILLLLIVLLLLYRQRSSQQTEPISGTAFKLNTVITVKIYDSTDESLIEEVFALCDSYEAIFSRTMESSELYQLNHGTLPQDKDGFVISPDMASLIAKGLEYSRLSDGGFDITIAPVSSLWDFNITEEYVIPDKDALNAALPLVNYQNLVLTENHVQFKQEGMALEFGGIAKGYIADRMKDYLVSKGVKSAIINLGGNVLCIGERPDNTSFQVGIQKPFAERNETIAILPVSDKSVVSSGIYERYFEKDGKLYHHILDPETGYPYDNSLLSVTIISDYSVDGDGLSTACFSLGLEKGMALIDSLPDVHAVFITADYELHYSKDFPL